MKKFVCSALLGVTSIVVTGPVAATNIYGVNVVGPGFDMQLVGSVFETIVINDGDVLSGTGEIGLINGLSGNEPGGFCVNGACELTYEFGGYTFNNADGIPSTGDEYFTGGWLKIYLDNDLSTNNFNPFSAGSTQAQDIANATDGTLWLTLVGHSFLDGVTGLISSLLPSGSNIGGTNPAGTGVGALSVDLVGVQGVANAVFDTNGLADGLGGFYDFDLGSSFSVVDAAGTAWPLGGSVNAAGDYKVPEPLTLSLFATGLIGLGVAAKKRNKKAA